MDYIDLGNSYVRENFKFHRTILKCFKLKNDKYEDAVKSYEFALKIFKLRNDFKHIILTYEHIAYCFVKQKKSYSSC